MANRPYKKLAEEFTSVLDKTIGIKVNIERSKKECLILFISLVREIYDDEFVPLHRPVFSGDEEKRVVQAVKSNFVSSAGQDIEIFERELASFTGARYAVATVNGTAALQVALHVSDVSTGDEVITQAVSFVATANAISYCGAKPIFIDIELDTLSMSPSALRDFLQHRVEIKFGQAYNKKSGARVKACLPMHSLAIPQGLKKSPPFAMSLILP